uniref:LRRCT domain-containing protein n=1 Tax=Arion vulgaris TaxID=1028688 RepID=A0A0B7ACX7_9EUPU
MTGLEELDLSKNKLTTLHDDLFQYLTTLKLLNLSYNGLNIIQWFTLFRSLELLVDLDMGYNNISSLEEAMFLPLPNIQTVSLRNNRLRNIIPRTFQNLNEIKVIDFSNNPFDCSCDTLSFRDWLKKSSLPIHGLYAGNSTAYNCWTPYSRAGLHVTQWSSEQFECDKSMLYVIVFCTTFVILTVIGLLAAALYRLYVKWRNRKAEIKRELELEEERRKRAKKVDFVRMSEKKLVKDSYEGQEKQHMYENTDIRNGFVPWPGSVMTSGKAGNQGDKNIDNNRSSDHVKIVNRERERSKGKHYERVKRDEFVEGELDKKRLLGQDERRGRRTTAASQNELVDKRDLRIERAARRRESENSNAGVFHLQEASSHKGPSHYEAFARDPRKGRELDRPVYFDRHPQRQSSGPYIISSANTLPNRWVDNSRDWNLPQQWNNQDYRKPRNQDHRLNNYSYTSLPIWDNETPRYEREIALRNGVNDDHQMEAHFDETRQPNRNTRPDRDILDRRSPYHKRSQSHNIIPQDYAEWDQGAYEAIRQTRPRTANGHRAVSQPFLNNEEASEWL